MEFVTVVLSGLLLLISPVGIVIDQVAENAIRDQLAAVESIDVRVDNDSSLNLFQGRVDRVRIATRGISPIAGLRIAVAELETDAIDLEFASLSRGEVVLDEALQGAVRLVIDDADLNTFLVSPFVQERLANIKIGDLNQAQARERERYKIKNPRIEFLTGDRLKVTAELEDLVQEGNLLIEAETGLSISAGDRLMLVDPVITANGAPVPSILFREPLRNINRQLSLSSLEQSGVTARALNFAIGSGTLELALWVRVDPSVTAPPPVAARP